MKRGSSFMEYMIVIGIVSLVLTGMNIYIKRGMQAQLKDMTDYFITAKQDSETNPGTTTASQSKSRYSSNLDTQLLLGGGSRTTTSETASISAASSVINTDRPYNEKNFVPAAEGLINPSGEAEKQENAAQAGAAAGGVYGKQ